jgi:Tol biopolymer transport system component
MFSSKEPRSVFPLSWSKHGFLLVRVFDAKNGNDIAVISLNDTTPESRRLTPLLTTAYNENGAVFSPDGRWIAYASDETGIPEIYVHSFQPDAPGEAPRVGRRFPVSSGGAGSLQWRADSKALFFMTAARDIMIVDWTDDPERPFGKPRLLRKARIGAPNGDMTTDGRSLVLAPVGRAGFPPLTVVVNWQSMLSN